MAYSTRLLSQPGPAIIRPVISKLSHDWNDETLEAKARWFQSLSLAERMDLLCAFTDLALVANPGLADVKNAQQTQGRVRVLAAPRG
jgi:hypothetical protein